MAQNEGTAAAFAAEMEQKVEKLVSEVKERAEDLKKIPLEEVWGAALDFVRENPGKAILISLGVGFVVGSLLSSRK